MPLSLQGEMQILGGTTHAKLILSTRTGQMSGRKTSHPAEALQRRIRLCWGLTPLWTALSIETRAKSTWAEVGEEVEAEEGTQEQYSRVCTGP